MRRRRPDSSRTVMEQTLQSCADVGTEGLMTITEPVGQLSDLAPDSPAPDLRTELPGPVARQIIARDEARHEPVAHPRLPARRAAGEGLRHRGRRRQPLPRLQRRHRRRRRRPRPPGRQRRHPRPGRRRPALLLERLLPAGVRRGLRAARRPGTDGRRHACSSATPAPRPSRPRSSWPATTPAAPTRSPSSARFHGRSIGSLSLTASKARQRAGFGVVSARHVPRPVLRSLRPGRAERRRVHRAGAVRDA